WLADDGTLRMRVPEEIEALRYDARHMDGLTVAADSETELEDVRGDSLELAIEMDAPGAKRFGVKVLCSPEDDEETLLFYDAEEKKLKVDTTRSSLKVETGSVEAGPFELRADERLKLRVFVDKSVVEVFANDRQAVMRRVYPSRADSVGVALFSEGAPANVPRTEAWRMMPSNPY
ncbi:MAG: GH32 C-terminal domain-containing protein, partial [Planctomycetota bacterium]